MEPSIRARGAKFRGHCLYSSPIVSYDDSVILTDFHHGYPDCSRNGFIEAYTHEIHILITLWFTQALLPRRRMSQHLDELEAEGGGVHAWCRAE